jgi:hypothetical protein
MNFLIAVGIAIAYLAVGFLFAVFTNENEDAVALDVFLWPVLIVLIIIIVPILVINEVTKAIYRRIKRR